MDEIVSGEGKIDVNRSHREACMKSSASLVCCVVAVFAFASGSPVMAAPSFNWGAEVNSGQCDKSGDPVVNVVQKVKNDADSGFGGYWAYDNYARTIKLWPQPDGSYCAVVQYNGQFQAIAGQPTPANAATLTGEEDGTFHGGYTATIEGTLRSAPLWKANGSVGTMDYNCDTAGHCPGAIGWVGQYFSSYDFSYTWWGWEYLGGPNGVWVNSQDGSFGDIH